MCELVNYDKNQIITDAISIFIYGNLSQIH